LFCLFLSSCEEDITLDVPPYQPKLAVYCVLYPDSIPRLFLNRSKAYFDYSDESLETQYIDNAQVIIEDVDTHQTDTLAADSGMVYFQNMNNQFMHYYTGHFKPKAGSHYKLSVNHNEMHLTGETRVPSAINLDPSDITYTTDSIGLYETLYHMKIRIHDLAGEENSYRLYSTGPYQYYYGPVQVISDLGSDGKDLTLPYDYSYYYGGGGPDTLSLSFQVENMTRATNDYITSVMDQQYNDDNPFVEPTIIKHNVTGGLGLFGASALGNRLTVKLR
jgi:hypothetical protein